VKFCAIAVALLAVYAAPIRADDDSTGTFRATLSGFNEVLPVFTTASGEVTVRVEESPGRILVTLKYSNLSSVPLMAHLHWGQKGVNGPVILPICGPGGETCPANGVERTFMLPATTLSAAAASGQATGFFPAANAAALVAGLRNGTVYANVHTQQFSGGEIRGQLGRGSAGSPGNSGNAPGHSDEQGRPHGNSKGK
jgi:hypothetical protein